MILVLEDDMVAPNRIVRWDAEIEKLWLENDRKIGGKRIHKQLTQKYKSFNLTSRTVLRRVAELKLKHKV